MKLTPGERLIVMMLADIHERIGGESVRPNFLRAVISGGHTWALDWEIHGLSDANDVPEEVVKEVNDALDMWSFIEDSVADLNEEERAELAHKTQREADPKFRGFDGNGESQHMSVARLMIDHMDRFQSFAGRDLNSHMPSMDGYNRMLSVYLLIRPTLAERLLSVDELAKILGERVHPSNR